MLRQEEKLAIRATRFDFPSSSSEPSVSYLGLEACPWLINKLYVTTYGDKAMAQKIKAKGSGAKLKNVFNAQLEYLGDYYI